MASRKTSNKREPGRDRSAAPGEVRELAWKDFDVLVRSLARKVLRDGRPQAVVGLAHGGVFVGAAVARALSCEFFPVRITRRSRDLKSSQIPRMLGKMPKELKGKRVLIVDDVSSSGDTLELAQTLAKQVGARGIRTAVLIKRPTGYEPHFFALRTDELVVLPWDYQSLVEEGRFSLELDS
jgi:hypoxanthine phosphoribosyltransferase